MVDDATLIERAYSVKKRFLTMYRQANAGHVGCSLSCAEMLVYLKFAWMNPVDTLILSKGHAAAALYSVLAEAGSLTEEDIATFYKDGTYLSAHPPVNKIEGIPFATGSLGHGLSLVAGMALGVRLRKQQRQFFCMTSDGELNEGSVWEAALFIRQHKLHNVHWFIDRNGLQGIGYTEEVMALEPLASKLRSFGFFVVEANGHDFHSLRDAQRACLRPEAATMPKAIICETIKGRGLATLEDTVDCHYLPLNEEQFQHIMQEIEMEKTRLLRRSEHAR